MPKGTPNVYWNQGGKAIIDFSEHRSAAHKDNWIAKRLKLETWMRIVPHQEHPNPPAIRAEFHSC